MEQDNLITHLTVRYTLVLGMLAVLAAGMYVIGVNQRQLNDHSSELINISGRQRMLSQRAALLSQNLATEQDQSKRDALRRDLQKIIETMGAAHQRLLAEGPGSMHPKGLSAELRQIYFGGEESLDMRVRQYLTGAQNLIDAADAQPELVDRLLWDILAQARNGKLLAGLDSAVDQQQIESEANLKRLKTQQQLGLVLTLLILGYSFWSIFRPMTRRLRMELIALHEIQQDLEKRVEENTREVRRLASAIQASAESIIITDQRAKIEFANAACQRLNGYRMEELVGENARIFQSGRTLRAIYNELWDAIQAKKIWSGEMINQRKDGTHYDTHLTIAPILDAQDDIDGFVGIQSDISKIKEYERQLQAANQDLERLVVTDSLTQLANRRRFDEVLSLEWRRCWRDGAELSLIMIDIDHFKKYNDSYGHQQGDVCLKRVADAIKSVLQRAGDVAARYGGEEFAVLLPEADINGAREIAELIRTEVMSLGIHAAPEVQNEHVTVSLGIATIRPDSSHAGQDELVARADAALYRAKNEGRNRVCA
ncbi:MAG: hypothetical protein A2V90_04155 [Gammaproteobacteria bacterium RBG_16_57_12]|nr:MAG: hypothetical protein A2V90_04155 [Gammaproteobacteria bacterium RBG_16_57_12]